MRKIMVETKTLQQIQMSLANGETCVINLTATWCPDCTEQAVHLDAFSDKLASQQVPCYNAVMQIEKRIYLSDLHASFTESMGGHGFPRTILVINGNVVDADNVEVISAVQLAALSAQFMKQL